MDSLEYIAQASRFATANPKDFAHQVRINLVTNFTDDILKNIFFGVSVSNGVFPVICKSPYKQYHFELKNEASELYANKPDLSFFLFDMNPFMHSAFDSSEEHFDGVLKDIERYSKMATGTVVVSHFALSYQGAYGNLFAQNPFFNRVSGYNKKIDELAARMPNLVVFETNRLVHLLGEQRVFDLRGLHAFDIPFTAEFMAVLAEEWFAYVQVILGHVKKCIVVDLDNTLWGGVVGELGALGIALGPDYPGNAFVNFQHALLEFYHRGVMLAINSKNNRDDVAEVFEKNPHMVLTEKHFSSIRANWDDKVENLRDIARELNIGTASMVFLDDDPLHRELVRLQLPEVSVPDFSFPPEEYANALYNLNLFNQFTLTEEDLQKGKMYAEERQRKKATKGAKDVNEYIANLNISLTISVNAEQTIPRLAQLTQKTNQFNLTTKRYSESDIRAMIANGALAISASASDKFGDYGTVILAIVMPDSPTQGEATLDTFLMSCRVMGRGIECAFLDYVIRETDKAGMRKLHGIILPTAKNKPIEGFLSGHGFAEAKEGYMLDISTYREKPCPKLNKAITIRLHS